MILASYTTLVTPIHKSYSFSTAWHIDSGATDHVCNNFKAFQKLQQLATPIEIRIGDNSTVLATGMGSILLSTFANNKQQRWILLTDVLYAPDFGTNLISVSKLNEKGCDIQFSCHGSVTILDSKDQWLGSAYKKNSIYCLQAKLFSQKAALKYTFITRTKLLLLQLWYYWLGYLNYPDIWKLSKMATGIQISKSIGNQNLKFCVPCLEGKFFQSYNKNPVSRATQKLRTIHSDLGGPFPTASISGARYFIIYIDDATRMTWVYFLKTKNAQVVLYVFQTFKALVEKEANACILHFRCDNGTGEYNNQLFKNYLSENGISFEPSAPYTQNQNGTSERAIQTIVEKARSMLSDAKLSEGFWEEAVRTAVYLKNRSPTRAVVSMTPFQAWSDNIPSLDHLWSFGCKGYYFVPRSLRTKWKYKSKPCTFLGYNENTTTQYCVWNRHRIVIVAALNS